MKESKLLQPAVRFQVTFLIKSREAASVETEDPALMIQADGRNIGIQLHELIHFQSMKNQAPYVLQTCLQLIGIETEQTQGALQP